MVKVRAIRRKRERCLVTREGYMLTQDDPHPHAVEEVFILRGIEEVRFVYDVTTIEADQHGRETEVAWYREAPIDGEDE